jgi:hypothetical protein
MLILVTIDGSPPAARWPHTWHPSRGWRGWLDLVELLSARSMWPT